MNKLKSDLMLLLTAFIWGTAFIAQIKGMENVEPFIFNGIRFAIGSITLIPFIKYFNPEKTFILPSRNDLFAGIFCGIILFCGSSLQQIGLVTTSAGNAGFITGLYVVIVPLIAVFFGFKPGVNQITGVIFAAIGTYLLSVPAGGLDIESINKGDIYVFAGSFFWALHVVAIGKSAAKINPILLSSLQFATCSIISIAVSLFFETNSINGIINAGMPILYSGFLSVGLAYTLQVIAQKKAPPTHAVLILTLESVFAAISGWIILSEVFTYRKTIGCILMFSGMIISQLRILKLRK